MNRKWIIASILIVALIALCGASLFAIWQGTRMVETSGIDISVRNNSVRAEGVEEKTLTVSGPASLTLTNDFGDVSVTGGADGQVKVIAEKTAWGSNDAEAQKELEELKVIIEQNGNNINISLQHPEQMHVLNLRPDIWSVKFTITVPEETAATLDSFNGDLVLSATTGNADLQTDFGNIQVSDVSGAVTVKTNNGNVTAVNLTSDADVSLTSDFGNISAQEISGVDITAKSTNGTLDLQNITASGVFKAGSDFGSIFLANSQASTIEIISTNGKITLENVDVDGKVTVHNDFGDQTLSSVDASAYDLKTQNGKIMLDQARDSITVQSGFGDVEVLNVENGTINLSSTNSAITFSGSLATGPHSVSSGFGNITLTLPAETALNVDLQTDFGKISSDFEITVSGALENNHWVGKFNGGGEELTVETNNGNITINSK
jgi:DUF4097 and DUF4098 domain-containing protein YvlB